MNADIYTISTIYKICHNFIDGRSMNQFIQTVSQQKGKIVQAIFEHLSMSLLALLIAVLIAIPLAILVAHRKRAAGALLQITGVFQTIPSLAILGLLIPFVGIGVIPTIIALIVYALLPIFQNTYVGLSEIDPALLEAADAFGMKRYQRLIRVELPLALPVIISGVRTALVFIIGTATLGGLIGAGGLGTFILSGLTNYNYNLVLIGALGSALLAIVFSSLLGYLSKRRPRIAIGILVLLAVGIGGVNFAQSGVFDSSSKTKETVIISGKLGTEPNILDNIYADLIKSYRPNIKVSLKENLGNTTFLFSALKDGKIDLYPEFTGTVLESLVKTPKSISGKDLSAQETYDHAKNLLNRQFGMTYAKPSEFQDTYAIAVKRDFAKKYHLKTIADLSKVEGVAKVAFDAEFMARSDGFLGLKSTYDLNFSKVSTVDNSLAYPAINSGKADIIDVYSTDSGIKRYGLTVLEDNKHLFPKYQAAPLMKKSFADKHSDIVTILNKLNGKLTDEQMREMNYQVDVKHKTAEKVALDFLKSEKLIK
ncbi:ABC transporter permease/substrate-binding protein [Lactococcus hircilactis]